MFRIGYVIFKEQREEFSLHALILKYPTENEQEQIDAFLRRIRRPLSGANGILLFVRACLVDSLCSLVAAKWPLILGCKPRGMTLSGGFQLLLRVRQKMHVTQPIGVAGDCSYVGIALRSLLMRMHKYDLLAA